MIIEPKIMGNVCLNAHPKGAVGLVEEQIAYAKARPKIAGPKNILIIGCSTGYGLATRIINAYTHDAVTLGVSFERAGSADKVGAIGWYNNLAFSAAATRDGKKEHTISGDAFSQQCKQDTIAEAKKLFGGEKINLVIYSVASPMRTAPDGITYRSVLKPLGTAYKGKTVDIFTGTVSDVEIQPATPEEALATVKVMGGEDWSLWIDALLAADLLAEKALTIAYSYIGPEMTYPLYREGTIGKAKEHLEKSVTELNEKLAKVKGKAYVSVNKAVVTRASSVIPVVPLYVTVLYKMMKKAGTHEGCIEQCYRLIERVFTNEVIPVDEEGRIRLDDYEMEEGMQEQIKQLWDRLSTETLKELADVEMVRREFMQTNGFEVAGVIYGEDVDPQTI